MFGGFNTRTAWMSAAAALVLGSGSALADITIIGALSNFDCPNNTGQVCDEFQIEFEGPHPEDVYYTWSNYNYGRPTVTSNPGGTGIIVVYKLEGHHTNPGSIEHFGVTFRTFNIVTSKLFSWKNQGVVIASGPGQVPVVIPTTTVVLVPENPEAPEGPERPEVAEAIENESEDAHIWIRRSVISVPGVVDLGTLMPDDPIIVNATPLEVTTELMEPGEIIESIEAETNEDQFGIFSQILVVETFTDIPGTDPATGQTTHTHGPLVSRAMTATVIQRRACDGSPTITTHPHSAEVYPGDDVFLTIGATGGSDGGELTYQWQYEGVDIPGETSNHTNMHNIREGEGGSYTCVVTNGCGQTSTNAARITVLTPCNVADVTGLGGLPNKYDGQLTVDDIIAFVNTFSDGVGCPGRRPCNPADICGIGGPPSRPDGNLTVDDVIAFFNAFGDGC